MIIRENISPPCKFESCYIQREASRKVKIRRIVKWALLLCSLVGTSLCAWLARLRNTNDMELFKRSVGEITFYKVYIINMMKENIYFLNKDSELNGVKYMKRSSYLEMV